MTSLNPNALAEAQSASEMFDVMHPPRLGFDVYRDRPEPTGETMTRGETHALKRWHRSVHVWLVDPALGLLALQKRSPNKDTFPGRWDISAAGHIESGDESRPTAVRELAEELGGADDATKRLSDLILNDPKRKKGKKRPRRKPKGPAKGVKSLLKGKSKKRATELV